MKYSKLEYLPIEAREEVKSMWKTMQTRSVHLDGLNSLDGEFCKTN